MKCKACGKEEKFRVNVRTLERTKTCCEGHKSFSRVDDLLDLLPRIAGGRISFAQIEDTFKLPSGSISKSKSLLEFPKAVRDAIRKTATELGITGYS